MDLRSLKIFSAVAESGSLVVASRKVHLTPSAISHSLKALETELGCRLFERIGKRMVLNQAGDQLLAGISDPLKALENVAESIKRLGHWGQSRVRIAASTAACQHILPGVIRELKKTYPTLELQVRSGDTPQALELLRLNRMDLALCIVPENSPGLDVRPIFRDELMFVFSPAHPWAGGRPITRKEICAQQFIGYQRSSFTAALLADYFAALEIAPNVLMEVDSVSAIIELVKFNLGVSILAPWAVDRELTSGKLKMRPLGAKPLRRQWSIASLTAHPKTFIEETFFRHCCNQVAGLRLDRRDLPAPGS
jgi:DNA-binding transcriptional LysR family regulator